MSKKGAFQKIKTSIELANTTNDNTLGAIVILTALFTEFCLAELICAEADKVERALENDATVEELIELDESVAGVLDKIRYIEEQVNEKIEHGREIRNAS